MKFYKKFVLGKDEVSRARMIVPPYSVSKLFPFDYFLSPPPPQIKIIVRLIDKRVTVWDIFTKFYRNVYQVKIMCRVQLRLLYVSELWPFDCVLMLTL